MKRFIPGIVSTLIFLVGTAAFPADHAQIAAENKRKFQQQVEQNKRKFEEQRRKMDLEFKEHLLKGAGGTFASKEDAIPFYPEKAPPPAECFMEFVKKAKTAGSFPDILPYLPHAKSRLVQELQNQYKPAEAAKYREQLKKQSPNMDEEGLNHLTDAPFVRETKWNKRIAESVLRVIEAKVQGRVAKLKISVKSDLKTNAYGQWESFPYSTADVEMVGELNYWRFKSFNSNNTHYKNPQ